MVPDNLFARKRMLAFGEPGKMLVMDCAIEVPLAGKPALPFTVALLIAAPVILLFRGELSRVVGLGLPCGEWL